MCLIRPAVVFLLAVSSVLTAVYGATPPATTRLSQEETKAGFVSLFDGKTLDGWQGATKGYVVENGLLVCKKKGGGRLSTLKEYADFIFRFEFKLEPGGNNGVAIRSPLKGRPSRDGIEIQIIDNAFYADGKPFKLKPYQCHGSVYGLVPAKVGFMKPAGQWNSQEILCNGRKIKVTLNGTVIVDADLSQVDEKIWPHPGWKREKGYLGFIGHGARVEFRNIRIKEL